MEINRIKRPQIRRPRSSEAKTCDFAYFEETFLLIFKHCVRKGSFKRDWSSFCEKENLKKDQVGRDRYKDRLEGQRTQKIRS